MHDFLHGGLVGAVGETRLLSNAMLLTEGYDEPSIDCVVCLRPTKVRALYSQIVGRGTRLAVEKDHLLLLDFLWMSEEHNLVKPANLIASDPEEANAITAALGFDGDLEEAKGKADADRAATGLTAEVEMADHHASHHAPIVVASVQTLMRTTRRERWPRDHFGLVVVDEAHHSLADSYLGTLRHFDAHAFVLGVTATPDRGDKKNLGRYFQNIAYEVTLLDLIRQNWLVPIRAKTIPLEIDLDDVGTTAGDYNARDLGHAIEPYLARIADVVAEHRHRKILAFLPLVSLSRTNAGDVRRVHAPTFQRPRFKLLAALLDGSKIPIGEVCSDFPLHEQRRGSVARAGIAGMADFSRVRFVAVGAVVHASAAADARAGAPRGIDRSGRGQNPRRQPHYHDQWHRRLDPVRRGFQWRPYQRRQWHACARWEQHLHWRHDDQRRFLEGREHLRVAQLQHHRHHCRQQHRNTDRQSWRGVANRLE